jgi:hypothetical protein
VVVTSGNAEITTTNTGVQEIVLAYLFAYKNQITTQTTLEKADMNG